MKRRTVIASVLALGASHAFSQGEDAQLVRIVVPYAAGGPTDFIARVLAKELSDYWKRSVIVENRPGAAGNIGTAQVVRASADGTTLLLVPSGLLVVNRLLFASMPFDPFTDLTPITNLGSGPNFIYLNPKLPFKSLGDYVKFARENSGKRNFGSPAIGTIPHLVGEMLMQQTGIKILHVPYNGVGANISAVINGDVDFAVDTPAALTYVASGKLRPIAVLTSTRSPTAPEVPTVVEEGFPGLVVDSWYGLMAPPRMPSALAQRIRGDVEKVFRTEATTKSLASLGFTPLVNATDIFAAAMKTEAAQWEEVFRKAGIKPQ